MNSIGLIKTEEMSERTKQILAQKKAEFEAAEKRRQVIQKKLKRPLNQLKILTHPSKVNSFLLVTASVTDGQIVINSHSHLGH